jgi:hypothetical protein
VHKDRLSYRVRLQRSAATPSGWLRPPPAGTLRREEPSRLHGHFLHEGAARGLACRSARGQQSADEHPSGRVRRPMPAPPAAISRLLGHLDPVLVRSEPSAYSIQPRSQRTGLPCTGCGSCSAGTASSFASSPKDCRGARNKRLTRGLRGPRPHRSPGTGAGTDHGIPPPLEKARDGAPLLHVFVRVPVEILGFLPLLDIMPRDERSSACPGHRACSLNP